MKKNKKIVPKFLYDEHGKKVGVRLKRKEYKKLMDSVDDYHDYKTVLKFTKKKP